MEKLGFKNYKTFFRYTFIPPGVLYINATQLSDAGDYRLELFSIFLKKR